MNELRSTLDTHCFEPEIMKSSVCGSSTASQKLIEGPSIICKTPSKATKIKDLSSNLLGQECAYTKYSTVAHDNNVVELVVTGLPSQTQAADLKRVAGVKHIVEAIVDHDTIKNVCTGTGKIRVRLGEGEDLEQVKVQFLRAGLDVREAKTNPSKKPTFTYKQALLEKSPQRQDIDSKMTRVENLQSSIPETFGNTAIY